MTESSKKRSEAIKNTVTLVVIVLVLVLLFLIVYGRVTGKQVFSLHVLWVLSPSMEDTIPQKSYILVQNVKAEDVEVGDIITFRSRDPAIEGELNTHRVIEVIGDHEKFRTKGDHNPSEDREIVYAEDIVARYVRNLGVLTVLGRLFITPAGLIVTFLLILLSTAIWIFCVAKDEKSKKREAMIADAVAREVERLQAEGLPPEITLKTPPTDESDKNGE